MFRFPKANKDKLRERGRTKVENMSGNGNLKRMQLTTVRKEVDKVEEQEWQAVYGDHERREVGVSGEQSTQLSNPFRFSRNSQPKHFILTIQPKQNGP